MMGTYASYMIERLGELRRGVKIGLLTMAILRPN